MIGRLVVLVSLVLLVVALSSEAAPTGGALPSSFAANIQLFISASGHATNYYGTVYYDYLKLRRRLTVQDQYSRTIDALSRFDLEKQYEMSEGHCSVSYLSRNEADWFGWVSAAQPVGNFQVNGQTCLMYQLQAQNSILSACISGANVPLLLRFQTGPTDTQYVFSNLHVGPQPDSLFQIPSMCPRGLSAARAQDSITDYTRPIIIPLNDQ